MQNAQEINWWVILLPSLVVALSAIIVQILLAYWLSRVSERYKNKLSKEIEEYKKDIGKEIESYKINLQAEFQRNFHEYQIKFSWYHQKEAEAIEHLFELLARVEISLLHWASADGEVKNSFYRNVKENRTNLNEYFDTKRIYFDDDIASGVFGILEVTSYLLISHRDNTGETVPEIQLKLKNLSFKIIEENIRPIMKNLEHKFKILLSTANQSHQIQKT
jgi:hypothetical protein